jgi:hypothetical protein
MLRCMEARPLSPRRLVARLDASLRIEASRHQEDLSRWAASLRCNRGAVITRPLARARDRQPQFGPPPLPKSNDV